jgi:hypothetical protein
MPSDDDIPYDRDTQRQMFYDAQTTIDRVSGDVTARSPSMVIRLADQVANFGNQPGSDHWHWETSVLIGRPPTIVSVVAFDLSGGGGEDAIFAKFGVTNDDAGSVIGEWALDEDEETMVEAIVVAIRLAELGIKEGN